MVDGAVPRLLLRAASAATATLLAFAVSSSARADSPAARASATAGAVAGAPSITKGPYLQGLTTTAVVVKVELATAADASVDVLGPEGDGGARFHARPASTEPRRFHVLRIGGLTPATSYEYRLTVAGSPSAEVGHFTTAPADARPFRFVLYGDNRSDTATHAAIVRAIEKTETDFLVHTGDMVGSGASGEEWTSFFAVESRLLRDHCLFAAIGNHELYGGERVGESAFLRYFAAPSADGAERPRLYATFRWSNTRFFVLNAMDDWTGAERDWLRRELESAQGEAGLVHRIAVVHQSPFSSGPHGGSERLAEAGIIAMLRDGKVDLLVAGHDHIYERGEGAGLKYVISGGAGAPLYPRKRHAKQTLAFESAYHFVRVSVDGDRIELAAERLSGGLIERCVIRPGSPWECEGSAAAKASSAPASSVAPSSAPAPVAPAARGPAACGCSLPGSNRNSAGLAVLLALVAAAATRRRAAPR